MNIERRLRKLEPSKETGGRECHRLIVEKRETEDEVICQHFGDEGPPEIAFIVLRQII